MLKDKEVDYRIVEKIQLRVLPEEGTIAWIFGEETNGIVIAEAPFPFGFHFKRFCELLYKKIKESPFSYHDLIEILNNDPKSL